MKILVADDEKSIASLFKDYLETVCNHEVMVAYSGHEALNRIFSEKPDLIILDILMPGLSGFQVLDAIKRNPETSDIPVVLSSVISGPSYEDEKRLGIVSFLRKPLDFEKLNNVVNQIAQGPKRLSVLLVDDDEDDVDLLSVELQHMNCALTVARDGGAAVQQAIESRPDLIILDYLLPIKTGLDVIRELKSSPLTCDIPVILISAYTPPNEQSRRVVMFGDMSQGSGPISVKNLCQKIKEILPVTLTQ